MSTSLAAPATLEQALLLRGVTWEDYVRYRDDPANSGARMTYQAGVLEIMTLSYIHEAISLLIHNFITLWQLHRNLDIQPAGSMTLRSAMIQKGLESDQYYYIRHAALIRSEVEIDVEHFPPDLAIEVDHRHASIRKLPIYVSLQVAEVWQWREEKLLVLVLQDEQYVAVPESKSLPGFPLDLLRDALSRRKEVSQTELAREFQRKLT